MRQGTALTIECVANGNLIGENTKGFEDDITSYCMEILYSIYTNSKK